MKKFTLAAVVLSLASVGSSFGQCMMLETPLSERVQASAAIFEGKVIGKSSFWNPAQTNIYTSNTIEVYKVFKGNLSTSLAEVITPGGIVGNSMEIVNPSLELTEGQTGIFLVGASEIVSPASSLPAERTFNAYYGPDAFIKYDLTEASASDVFHRYDNIPAELYSAIENQTGNHHLELKKFTLNRNTAKLNPSAMAPSITGFSPTSITAGTLSTLTINGSGFGTNSGSAKVEFKNADDGGATWVAALPSHIVSWTATKIEVKVPSKVGTGTVRVTDNAGVAGTSTASVTMPYGQITAVSSGIEYRLKLANKNTSGGYTFKYCTTFNNNANAVASFDRAMMTWKCATNVNFIVSGTTADACHAKDGTNIINYEITASCAMGSNLLGITNSYFDGCSSGGTWYWTMTEMDMRFKGNTNWNYGPGATSGGKTDFETVALHEIAHAHGEAHVIDPPALMHWNRSTNTDVRTLSAGGDIACGNEILTRSIVGNPCGATAHTKLVPSNCATGIIAQNSNNSISVFPNPFSGTATLRIPSPLVASGLSLGVFDAMGNQVYAQAIDASEFLLDASGFSSGIYFFRITNAGNVVDSGKLIITQE